MGGCRRVARGDATWRDPGVPTTRPVGTGTRRARDMLAEDAWRTMARRAETAVSTRGARSTRDAARLDVEAGGGDVVVIIVTRRPALVILQAQRWDLLLARSARRFLSRVEFCARRRVDDRLARRAHTSSRRERTASRVYRPSASLAARAIERHGASDGRVRVPAMIRIPARGSRPFHASSVSCAHTAIPPDANTPRATDDRPPDLRADPSASAPCTREPPNRTPCSPV